MTVSGNRKKVLVLLIGEVLEDPRVYKTCISLGDMGAEVTVACTNPSHRPKKEKHKNLSIIRFPHRSEFVLKRLYKRIQDVLHPEMGQILLKAHEDIPGSSVMSVLRNFVLNLNFRHFIKSSIKINRMMVRAFTGERFDLVHCNDVDTLTAGSELKRNGVAKVLLYDSHEYWQGIGVHSSWANDSLCKMEASCIRNADFVVTVNPLIADLLAEQYMLNEIPSVVMNCPYRYDGVVNTDKVHSPVRVIYQGKLQAFRGLSELILAFRYVDNGILTISGYGPLQENLRLLAESEHLIDKVFFTGRFKYEDGARICAGHDIGIISFRDITLNIHYSSPNKLFDYAMAGLAVVSGDIPFIAKVIDTAASGRLFRTIDPEHMAETINAMISDTEQLKKFKKNARKSAMEKFCWEEQFLKNYPWKP